MAGKSREGWKKALIDETGRRPVFRRLPENLAKAIQDRRLKMAAKQHLFKRRGQHNGRHDNQASHQRVGIGAKHFKKGMSFGMFHADGIPEPLRDAADDVHHGDHDEDADGARDDRRSK